MFKICALNESSSEAESDTESGGDLRSPGGSPAGLVQQRLAAACEEQQGWGQDQLAGNHQLQLVSVRGGE